MKRSTLLGAAAGAFAISVCGCVPPPGGYATGAPYVAPQPDYGADQLTYVDGVPYVVYGGQQLPVVFDGGLGWGYYDGYHRWHGASGGWRGDLERRYPGGRGFSAGAPGGYGGARPGGYQPPQGRPPGPPPGQAQGQPQGYRVSAPGPGPGPRPQAAPPPRPAAPPPRPAPSRGAPACGQAGAPRC